MADVFNDLFKVNVNDHTEDREGLTYLSWAWAWAEVKKRYPDATYTVWKGENNLPYVYDPLTGYMVYTTVTIDGITHEMWLPVMNGNNKAMKSEPYVVRTKYKEIRVDAATMFDINKTIMRCLTKNLAMFGLGLYIYAGTDLPDVEDDEPQVKIEEAPKEEKPKKTAEKPKKVAEKKPEKVEFINQEQIDEFNVILKEKFPKEVRLNVYHTVLDAFGANNFASIPIDRYADVRDKILSMARNETA